MQISIKVEAPLWLQSAARVALPTLAIAVAGIALGGPPVPYTSGETLSAADLNASFAAVTPVWASYTPTIASDGTTLASRSIRGGTFRYMQVGHTVCLQGLAIIGQQSPGAGGTYVKVSLPSGLSGKTGTTQIGIGTAMRTGDATTLFNDGTGVILAADTANVELVYGASSSFIDGDARAGAGIAWAASGCYETD